MQFLDLKMGEAHTVTVECRIFYGIAAYFLGETFHFFNSQVENFLKLVILNSAANSAVIPTKHLCRFNRMESL